MEHSGDWARLWGALRPPFEHVAEAPCLLVVEIEARGVSDVRHRGGVIALSVGE